MHTFWLDHCMHLVPFFLQHSIIFDMKNNYSVQDDTKALAAMY